MDFTWLIDHIDRIGTIFCLAVAVWYFNRELRDFKQVHNQELSEMRKEHKEERESIIKRVDSALDKIAIEMRKANDERAEIRLLLVSMKDFHITLTHNLSDYDRVLNKIATKLDIDDNCEQRDYKRIVNEAKREPENPRRF